VTGEFTQHGCITALNVPLRRDRNALGLLVSLLHRQGQIDMAKYAGLAIQGSLQADSRPEESHILPCWAAIGYDVPERDTPH